MGTTAQKLEYLNTTKTKIKESINLTNANITNEPFRQYALILKNRLPEIVGNPSIIWNNYEHVTGSGTSINISTYKSIFEYSLDGNTTQSGTPTPDVPVPVNTVTGNQTITINDGTNTSVKYINLGKNLFNKNNIRDGYRFGSSGDYYADTPYCATEFISVKPNTTYYRNITITQTKSVCTYDQNQTFIARLQSGNSFTTPNNCYYIRTSILITEKDTCQVEEGSTATSYAPYFEPIELCKIGTYQDRIYKSNGKWYLHKETGKVVLDGSESGITYEGAASTPTPRSTFRINLPITLGTNLNYFSNNFMYNSQTSNRIVLTANSNRPYISIDNTVANINVNDSNDTKIQKFKTWLETDNTFIYLILATATTEEIKNYDLLNDLNSLELMTGSITITVSGDLPSPIDITAIKN